MNIAVPFAGPGRDRLLRAARCLSVSLGTTAFSSVILVGLAVGLGLAAGPANFIAVVCGIPPSYVANRRWVWAQRGRGSVTGEVIPFWAMSLAALACSTWFVGRVGAATATWPASGRSIVLPAASAATFAALWVVQFVVLDRVIFGSSRVSPRAGGPGRASPESVARRSTS